MAHVISSLLDNDYYQFKMSWFFWKAGLGNKKAKFKFIDRGNSELLRHINSSVLSEEIYHLVSMKVTNTGLDSNIFDNNWLDYVNSCMKDITISCSMFNNNLHITYSGPIAAAVLLETPILATINELYFQEISHTLTESGNGVSSVDRDDMFISKLQQILRTPEFKFVEFGSRRRYSRLWQEYILWKCLNTIPENILGTSNVLFSNQIGLKALGTMAHVVPMAYSAICDDPVMSQTLMVFHWSNLWGLEDTYWLTDTFGTDWFLKHCYKKGMSLRQDSGDPEIILDKYIKCFEENDEDPMSKRVMCSDGLTLSKAIDLQRKYKNKIGSLVFGWGTNLTCDTIFKPLKIVIKLAEFDGKEVAKLSDNPEKATGSVVSKYREKFAI